MREYKRLGYVVGASMPVRDVLKSKQMATTPIPSWTDKCNYVRSQIDVRSHICIGCGSGKIYDKNNVMYVFTRFQTMEQIKELVEKVRKINQAE